MQLNNREIAFLVWIAIGLIVLFRLARPRKALLLHLLSTLASRKILTFLCVLIGWTGACVYLLYYVGWWGWSNLKTTLEWGGAFSLAAFAQVNPGDRGSVLKTQVVEAMNVVVIVAFISSVYVFNLAVEFVLAFLVISLTLVISIAERDSRLRSISTFASVVVVAIGAGVFIHALYRAASDLEGFLTANNAREFAIPLILTILSLPFLYGLRLFFGYEGAFDRLNFLIKDHHLRRYATHRVFFVFKGDLVGLKKWLRHITLFRPGSDSELEQSFSEIRRARARENRHRRVPPPVGWMPNEAVGFLESFGLKTRDYHRIDGGWFASSPYVELGDGVLKNNVALYLEGGEFAVLSLKLVLNMNSPADERSALEEFQSIAAELVNVAVRDMRGLPDVLSVSTDAVPISVNDKRICLARENWVGGIDGGYELVLTISASESQAANDALHLATPSGFVSIPGAIESGRKS